MLSIKTEGNKTTMSDFQDLIIKTTETICDDFCKFSGSGDSESGCVWCQMHEGACPFDELLERIGEADER